MNNLPRIECDQGFNIAPPMQETIAAGGVFTLEFSTVPQLGRFVCVNLGTGTIKFAYNTTAKTNEFHDIIPGASALNAGDGGRLSLDRKDPFNNFTKMARISFFSDAGTVISLQFFMRTDVVQTL